jgi:hypothetical protein
VSNKRCKSPKLHERTSSETACGVFHRSLPDGDGRLKDDRPGGFVRRAAAQNANEPEDMGMSSGARVKLIPQVMKGRSPLSSTKHPNNLTA